MAGYLKRLGGAPIMASSGNVANASAAATIPAVSGKTAFISGFEITGGGATAAALVIATLTGVATQMNFIYGAVAGVALANQPLIVQFTDPIPASGPNTAIVLTCPALGAGNTNNCVNVHGFYSN